MSPLRLLNIQREREREREEKGNEKERENERMRERRKKVWKIFHFLTLVFHIDGNKNS